MEATKERREQRKAGDEAGDAEGDTVQLPTETSPYVQYDNLEDYKMRGYGAQGHLPVSDVLHGGSGTDAPTVPGTAVPVANPNRRDDDVRSQRGQGGGDAARRGDTATDAINRHGVP
uniref:Late embryogenesis abundant n=1 Tax=Cleistogenes songorica TaxID=121774 RepID=A0A2S1WLU9_9POAL|nr:late embryogenesis abundant [Cleistogenes songorica]